MRDIFLSYSRDDQPTARRFAEGLEREGFSVWWDQALNAGEAFDKVTEQALDAAKAVVVLWSKKSVESRWVRAEATQANANNRLVPVMIEPCRRPIMFELTHTADLSHWDGDNDDPDWQAFIDGLRKTAARDGTTIAATPAQMQRRRRRKIGWFAAAGIAGLAAALSALLVWGLTERDAGTSTAGALHLSLQFNESASGWPMGTRRLALSRDGTRIAYSGTTHLQIRALSSSEPISLDLRAGNPFFSPDGAWVGFFGEPAGLSKVPAAGGAPVLLASFTERQAGATWSSNGWILFATTAGLFRVSADGGEPELIARPDAKRNERLYAWPEVLPGDEAVLFTVLFDDAAKPPQIVWRDLASGKSHVVLTGGTATRFARTGHLLYASQSGLSAIRFDPKSGKTSGSAVPLASPRIAVAADNGAAEFAVSENGTLASSPPNTSARAAALMWVDSKGTETSLGIETGPYGYARVSPDGQRIAIDINSGSGRDIWILDLRRSTLTQLTRGPTEDMLPEWSVDGRRVFFASDRGGDFDIYSQAADGSDDARLEVAAPGMQAPHVFTPDGGKLVLLEDYTRLSIATLGGGALQPLLHGDAEVWLSVLSPDGQWLAYESKESGAQPEIFLRPFPEVGARREKISVNGGRYPLWGGRGSNELYYVNLEGDMMRVAIRFQPELQAGTPMKLFRWQAPPPGISGRPFDISPVDGRFLMRKSVTSSANAPAQASVVLNWFEELRRVGP